MSSSRLLFGAQFRQLLLDLDGFQPRQLAQADFEDVLGLALERREAPIRRLGLVRLRMMAITSSMLSSTSCRPSRMWMRSMHLAQAVAARRRAMVARRKPIHL